jgi:holliday junction DNA helicase RuvA
LIAFLRGVVASVGEDAAVVDVHGVGYLVQCSSSTLQRLPRLGHEAELHVETQVREDSITLFGFLDPADRVWFRLLQSVQGVGAKAALAILGVLRPHDLATAIAIGDKAAITRANGVGAKLAARIVAELKDKVGGLPSGGGAGLGAAALAAASGPVSGMDDPAVSPLLGAARDAVSALGNLGYGRGDAFAAVARVQARLGAGAAVDQLIREALRELAA